MNLGVQTSGTYEAITGSSKPVLNSVLNLKRASDTVDATLACGSQRACWIHK